MAAVDIMDSTGGEQYTFYIATPERFWKFAAPSVFEMQEWIRVLREERKRLLVRFLLFSGWISIWFDSGCTGPCVTIVINLSCCFRCLFVFLFIVCVCVCLWFAVIAWSPSSFRRPLGCGLAERPQHHYGYVLSLSNSVFLHLAWSVSIFLCFSVYDHY